MSLDQGSGRRKARTVERHCQVNLDSLISCLGCREQFSKANVESDVSFQGQSL